MKNMNGHFDDCECETCVSINKSLNENEKKEKELNDFRNMFAEQEPASQLLVSSDDEGPEQDDEIDLVTPPKPAKRLPVKKPMSRAKRFLDLAAEEDDDVPPSSDDDVNMVEQVWPPVSKKRVVHEEELQYPDLEAYFRQRQFKHVSNFTKISQCRTFANYLAQVEKAKGEARKGKK